MPINLPDFSGQRKSALQSYLEGYSGFHAPMNMLQGQEQQRLGNEQMRLANIFNQAREPYANELAMAEAEKEKQNNMFGGLDMTGELGNIQKLYKLKQMLGEDHPLVKEVQRTLERQEYSKDILNSQREDVNANRSFKNLPANERELLLAKLRAAGVPAVDAERIKRNETTLEEYLSQKGLSTEEINNLVPNHAPTKTTQSTVQQIQGSLAEDDYIGPKITEALGGYGRKILGYSPKQIMDEFQNKPSTLDKRARALAARALIPELAGYRSRIAGGSNAHEALSELTKNSLNALNVFESMISPEEYTRAQHYIHEWQQGMGNARIQGMQGVYPKKTLSGVLDKGPKSSDNKGFTVMEFIGEDGNRVKKMIPEKHRDKAIEAGGKVIE